MFPKLCVATHLQVWREIFLECFNLLRLWKKLQKSIERAFYSTSKCSAIDSVFREPKKVWNHWLNPSIVIRQAKAPVLDCVGFKLKKKKKEFKDRFGSYQNKEEKFAIQSFLLFPFIMNVHACGISILMHCRHENFQFFRRERKVCERREWKAIFEKSSHDGEALDSDILSLQFDSTLEPCWLGFMLLASATLSEEVFFSIAKEFQNWKIKKKEEN